MARNRSIRHRQPKTKHAAEEINVTSLLDTLMLLLIFLLTNNSFTGKVINVLPGLTLPKSKVTTANDSGVIIQVSQTEIWVDEVKILSFDEATNQGISFDQGGRRIVPLYNELVRKKDEVNAINKEVPRAIPFSGIANLVFDEKLKYDLVKKVMYTAAEAGFLEYKFIVLGEAQ